MPNLPALIMDTEVVVCPSTVRDRGFPITVQVEVLVFVLLCVPFLQFLQWSCLPVGLNPIHHHQFQEV